MASHFRTGGVYTAERGITFASSTRASYRLLEFQRERLLMTAGIGIDKASELTPKDFDRLLLRTLTAVKKGDFRVRMPVEFTGTSGKIADTLNEIIELNDRLSGGIERIATEVGTEGKLGGQAEVRGVAGTWKDLTDSVNSMASNLTNQVRNIAEVTTSVANGDLSKKITVEVRGEIQELKNTINTMVDQLRSFASEVTRVAREVGTEGKLGGQAQVKGVAGT